MVEQLPDLPFFLLQDKLKLCNRDVTERAMT